VKVFWIPRYQADVETTPTAAREKLKTLLIQSIDKRMESDVPMAALLSGGLDSSLIVAVAAKELGVRLKTLHARFRHDEAGESRYAEQVAALYRTEHEEIEVSPQHLDSLPKVLRFFSEPYADDSALPSFLVYRALKKRATVAVTGDGGDEIFAGYLHARGYYWREVLGRRRALAVGANALTRLIPGYRRYDSLRRLVSFGRYLGLESAETFALTRSTSWNEDAGRLLERATAPEPYLQSSFRKAQGETDFEKMLIADIVTTLPDAYLLKVDRMSMAVSVEARCPLLDIDLMEAAHTIPPRILMPRGRPKGLAQKIAEDYLPREWIDRPKRGFSLPLAGFLKQISRDLIFGIVNHPKSFAHQYFDRSLLEEQIRNFYLGESYLSYKVWSILCLEIWYRLHYTRDIEPSASLQDLR
jgi:asparagine synthase (glutamine-hydrolysing)